MPAGKYYKLIFDNVKLRIMVGRQEHEGGKYWKWRKVYKMEGTVLYCRRQWENRAAGHFLHQVVGFKIALRCGKERLWSMPIRVGTSSN